MSEKCEKCGRSKATINQLHGRAAASISTCFGQRGCTIFVRERERDEARERAEAAEAKLAAELEAAETLDKLYEDSAIDFDRLPSSDAERVRALLKARAADAGRQTAGQVFDQLKRERDEARDALAVVLAIPGDDRDAWVRDCLVRGFVPSKTIDPLRKALAESKKEADAIYDRMWKLERELSLYRGLATLWAPWDTLPEDAQDPNRGRECVCGVPIRQGCRHLHKCRPNPLAEARKDSAEKAEAKFAALRAAAGEVARKARYGSDTHADYMRLEAALTDSDVDAAAASYRARVEAEVLERTAELWLTSVDGNVRTSDRERMHNWLIRRANDIRSEAAKRAEKSK